MRIALGIEYNGTDYFGWQKQRQRIPTIQGELQVALSKIANESIYLHCAGRTDAKVHATGQVVHFDTCAKRHVDAWIWGTNAELPPAIVVRWAKAVDYHFHARFSAIARKYRYIIYNHPIRPAVLTHKVSWYYYPLQAELMHEAAQLLVGEHDFSSFRASQCNAKSPTRSINMIRVKQQGKLIVIDVEANAFLHHMVRNIVGVLFEIGTGKQPAHWMKEVLLAKSRRAAAITAPADGLYLTQVQYPEPYIFQQSEPVFLL